MLHCPLSEMCTVLHFMAVFELMDQYSLCSPRLLVFCFVVNKDWKPSLPFLGVPMLLGVTGANVGRFFSLPQPFTLAFGAKLLFSS